VSRRGRITLKAAVWAACLAPLAWLGHRALTIGLGANPIDFVTDTLGDWTLRLLLSSLAMTPLRIVFGWGWPALLRRLLGLFAFFYACLHLGMWVVVDQFFDVDAMLADVAKRRYITVGLAAILLLLPLAVTSTAAMIRRLGTARWQRLHRLAYVVAILGVLHYLWLAKKGVQAPYVYAGVLLLLLGIRAGNRVRSRWARASLTVPHGLSRVSSGEPS
jgi:sulfoxide reductase heme-binding subunit YedZ